MAGAGDRCLLYTDGVVEAQNRSSEELGVDRLKDFLKRHSQLAGDEFSEQLLKELTRWSELEAGESQTDDITLLTVTFGRAA